MNETVTMARKCFLFAATPAVFTFIKTNYLVEFLRVGLFGFQL